MCVQERANTESERYLAGGGGGTTRNWKGSLGRGGGSLLARKYGTFFLLNMHVSEFILIFRM